MSCCCDAVNREPRTGNVVFASAFCCRYRIASAGDRSTLNTFASHGAAFPVPRSPFPIPYRICTQFSSNPRKAWSPTWKVCLLTGQSSVIFRSMSPSMTW